MPWSVDHPRCPAAPGSARRSASDCAYAKWSPSSGLCQGGTRSAQLTPTIATITRSAASGGGTRRIATSELRDSLAGQAFAPGRLYRPLRAPLQPAHVICGKDSLPGSLPLMRGLVNRTASFRRAVGAARSRQPSTRPGRPDLEREPMAGRPAGVERAVSTLIYNRLDPATAAELERRVAARPEFQLPPPDEQDPTERFPLLLSYGIWLGVPGVAEQTGLSEVQPPEKIHTMARGPLAAGGWPVRGGYGRRCASSSRGRAGGGSRCA